jgi:quinoprotein glucose dehydrogenase
MRFDVLNGISGEGMITAALRFLFIAFLALVGGTLAWLGADLLRLGGSPYYVIGGIVIVASGLLIARRDWRGVWLYAAFLIGTILWSLWESGLDGWALAPRLGMPLAIGLWMLTPVFRRGMGETVPLPGGRAIWTGLLAIAVLAIGYTFWLDRIEGGREMAAAAVPADAASGEWRSYGNDAGGSRYSPLAQITPANVGGLEPVWTYHVGEAPPGMPVSLQVNPLMVNGRVFICTGWSDVVALDAETGKELWRHHSGTDSTGVLARNCRGVTYYAVPDAKGLCAERVFAPTIDARLIALDAVTGKVCPGFGVQGAVDLKQGMGDFDKGYYYATSPPMLIRGKLVLGGWVTDGQMVGEPSGVVRAYDAVTGAFAWAFDIGRPDFHGMPAEGQTFTKGTPNSWAPMSADEQLGLVYIPTGNATPDYVGMHRTANDARFSSSVVALDANTGGVRWAFQTTHHDVWDYDVGSQPTLVDLPNGTPVVIQPTKRGEIFVLDRRTGKPVMPVVEKPVPTTGAAPGERMSATQPFSPGVPTFGGPPPTERTMWGLTPIDQAMCRIRFRKARFEGTMTPIGLDRPTITWPGYLGGVDWGGVAIDKKRMLMIVNNNQVANYNQLITRAEADRMGVVPITSKSMRSAGGPSAQLGTPYAALISPFLSPLAIPCQQPPYGMINAVDLRTGKMVWSEKLGTSRDSGPLTLPTLLPIPMGVPNLGGAVATAGGVTFIGATQERMVRAYDSQTGKELWKAALPAGAQASPSVYWSGKSGRQFMIIASGGHRAMLSGASDLITAYALTKAKVK